jgi:hypothetical protein
MIRILSILTFCALVASCSNSGSNQASENKSDSAYMYFSTDEFNFGKVNEGDNVTHTFVVENRGKSDLIIKTVRTSCGCTVANYEKKPIKKGELGNIELKLNTLGKSGKVVKTATVISNAIPDTKEIRLIGEVVTPINK